METPCETDNRQFIERLIDEYGDELLRICYIYLKDASLAQDALQDVYVKAWRSKKTFLHRSSEKTWLVRIAINTCKNYVRAPWYKQGYMSTPLHELSPSDEPVCETSFPDTALIKEIMELPPKYKEVILLFYYQELKVREIAELLNIPAATVSVRLKRAREILRNNLREWYYEKYD